MKTFDMLPKPTKKSIRYISQNVTDLKNLELIERQLNYYIQVRKNELNKKSISV